MRLHGDTVFIPENQEKKLLNGCISNVLASKLKVNNEVG